MSTFAFGICVTKSTESLTDLAFAIKKNVLSLNPGFYIEFGGHACAYWLYRKDDHRKGLAFDVTNSVVENTAEGVFHLTDKDFLSGNVEDSVSQRLTQIQEIIRLMFHDDEVEEILFYIVDDYCGPECLATLELCHSDCVAAILFDYCFQRLGSNLALRILR